MKVNIIPKAILLLFNAFLKSSASSSYSTQSSEGNCFLLLPFLQQKGLIWIFLGIIVILWALRNRYQRISKEERIRLNCSQKISVKDYDRLKKIQTRQSVARLLESDDYAAYMTKKLNLKNEKKQEYDEKIIFSDESDNE